MRRIALCALVVAGCEHAAPSIEVADSAMPMSDGAEADPDGPAANDPTACVQWTSWAAQQPTIGQTAWGTQLIDIAQHLPASYGDQYWSDDAITAGHETTHGIQAHLRNYVAPQSIGYNAFYVLGNKAAIVAEPHMRKSDIKPHIVQALRGSRYQLYLEQQTEWDDTPLYVFDEWTAYINGAEVGVGQVESNLYKGDWTDAVMGPLEFTVYAIATAATIKDKDPTYYNSNMQFRCFPAWNIARAMQLFNAGRTMSQFSWATQDAYATALRTGSGAADLRTFARMTWGATWTQQVLGF